MKGDNYEQKTEKNGEVLDHDFNNPKGITEATVLS